MFGVAMLQKLIMSVSDSQFNRDKEFFIYLFDNSKLHKFDGFICQF